MRLFLYCLAGLVFDWLLYVVWPMGPLRAPAFGAGGPADYRPMGIWVFFLTKVQSSSTCTWERCSSRSSSWLT